MRSNVEMVERRVATYWAAARFLASWFLATVTIGSIGYAQADPNFRQPRDPQDALKLMFERMGEQADRFVPGMFSQLDPQQMAELEKIVISPREESQLGDQVIKNYESSLRSQNIRFTRDANSETIRYLSQLVELVRPHMKQAKRYAKLDLVLVETDMIDAYSVPGGHLIFTDGLMQSVESEAELIGVIGHELSHLDRGHQLLPLKQAKSVNKLADFRTGMQWIGIMAKPFRPEFEAQADSDAVGWMIAAGYDPRQLARLLQRWDARQDRQAPWMKMMPGFARTHPESARRAEAVLRELDKSGLDADKLVIGRDNLVRRSPAKDRKRP